MQDAQTGSTNLTGDMRLAMRRLAASVVIVTTRHNDMRYALSVSAVTSVSLEPPTTLVCINRSASIYPPMIAKADFCINVLSSSHQALAIACSGGARGEGRFTVGNWRDDADTGLPYLHDAQTSLFCTNDGIHHYGTHGIFIGRVGRVHLHGDVDPLVYLDGQYISPEA